MPPARRQKMAVSIFDLFKIGIGPSSSHTVGPMRAARLFALRLQSENALPRVARVQIELYGSLGATGKGHGSDKAVLLGLEGEEPATVDVEAIGARLAQIRSGKRLRLLAHHEIAFDEKSVLLFFLLKSLPFHSNCILFSSYARDGIELLLLSDYFFARRLG